MGVVEVTGIIWRVRIYSRGSTITWTVWHKDQKAAQDYLDHTIKTTSFLLGQTQCREDLYYQEAVPVSEVKSIVFFQELAKVPANDWERGWGIF